MGFKILEKISARWKYYSLDDYPWQIKNWYWNRQHFYDGIAWFLFRIRKGHTYAPGVFPLCLRYYFVAFNGCHIWWQWFHYGIVPYHTAIAHKVILLLIFILLIWALNFFASGDILRFIILMLICYFLFLLSTSVNFLNSLAVMALLIYFKSTCLLKKSRDDKR